MSNKILLITNEEDPHADIIIKILGDNVLRLNTERILESFYYSAYLSSSDISDVYFKNSLNKRLYLNDITSVYYRRPEKPSINKDFDFNDIQIGEAWGGLYHFLQSLTDIPWMGHPFKDKINSSRILQLTTASNLGFDIPDTLISRDYDEISNFLIKHDRVAVKPLHERGKTLEGFWTPYFTEVRHSKEILKLNAESIVSTYNYMQEYIDKKREWRVTIVGEKIFPCVIESQKSERGKYDWRKEDIDALDHYYEKIPIDIEEKILKYCKLLGLNFGAMDLIETNNNEWYFLECNPNGQWLWIELMTKMKISSAIASWHINHI